jgi:hypothetical protein
MSKKSARLSHEPTSWWNSFAAWERRWDSVAPFEEATHRPKGGAEARQTTFVAIPFCSGAQESSEFA